MNEDSGLPETIWTAKDVQRLYEQHGAALVAYAASFLSDVARAEDAVHGVFLKLLSGKTSRPESEAGYLYRAVKNAAFNAHRSRARDVVIPADETWFQHRAGNLESVLALQKALGELPEEQLEVVMMRIWSGMTLEEVSSATGVALNTAASRYRYALEKLRDSLGARIANKHQE